MPDIPRIPFRSSVTEPQPRTDTQTGLLVGAAFTLGVVMGATTALLMTSKSQEQRVVRVPRSSSATRRRVVTRTAKEDGDSITSLLRSEAYKAVSTLGRHLTDTVRERIDDALGATDAATPEKESAE